MKIPFNLLALFFISFSLNGNYLLKCLHFKGSSAEFIPNLNLPLYTNKVFKLSEINQNSFMIGHILGGINSISQNPFSNNQTNQTNADTTIFEVWLKINPVSINEHEIDGKNPYDIKISPNPFGNTFNVKFTNRNNVLASYFVTNNSGQVILKSENKGFDIGENTIEINMKNYTIAEQLYLTVIFDGK